MLMMLALSGLMLLMLALCGSGAARGPTDADDARLVGPLRPSKGPADAADARFVRLGARLVGPLKPSKGQLMLLMLALCGSGAARGPTDADDARLVGPDAADARIVRLRRSKGPN